MNTASETRNRASELVIEPAVEPAIEHAISRALEAVNGARPLEGMDERLLRALRARTGSRVSDRRDGFWPVLFACAAVLLCFAGVAVVRERHAAEQGASSNQQRSAAGIEAATLRAQSITQDLFVRSVSKASSGAALTRGSVKAGSGSQDHVSVADRQAIDDSRAPSMVAPPMPLTAEEKLLQQAARPGSAMELAELAPSREIALRAEMTMRQNRAIERYVESMLAPLLTSEAIHPTQPVEEEMAAPVKETAIQE